MSDADETPAQRQARIRREKREAKIKAGGQERLDKITRVSGRTPESVRQYDSPVATPPRSISPAVQPTVPASTETAAPEQLRQQEEFLRAMLRSQSAPQQQQQQPGVDNQEVEDPMLKMLSSMLGNMGDDPNAPNSGLPSLNPDDIAKATGLPSFVTNMMLGKQETPATPADVKSANLWKMVHIILAAIVGIYMIFTVNRLTGTFGESPPVPATAQNPFVIFIMVELLLHGLKPFVSAGPTKSGPALWLRTAKDIGRDGAVVVFLMGAYSWWYGLA